MNIYPSWIHRVGEIIETVWLYDGELLDRQACEKLFNLRRVATVDMMKRFGAQQVGLSLVIRKSTLMARLREVQESPALDWTQKRRRRVAAAIASADREVRLKKTVIRTPPRKSEALPGITVTESTLLIEHCGANDLLEKLAALVQAIGVNPALLWEMTEKQTTVRRCSDGASQADDPAGRSERPRPAGTGRERSRGPASGG